MMIVDGLNPEIRAVVKRQCEDKQKSTYIELVQHTQAEEETHRSRSQPKTHSVKALLLDMLPKRFNCSRAGQQTQIYTTSSTLAVAMTCLGIRTRSQHLRLFWRLTTLLTLVQNGCSPFCWPKRQSDPTLLAPDGNYRSQRFK